MSCYYKNGCYYINVGKGGKIKMPLDQAGLAVEINSFTVPDASANLLRDATVKKENGNTVINYKIGATALQEGMGTCSG